MPKERVKYYSRNDFCYGRGLERIESIEIPALGEISTSDAIEYYEIKRYFDDNTRIKTWTDDEYERYRDRVNTLFGLTMRFFNSFDDDNIVDRYSTIDVMEHEAFWALFDKCKLYNKISEPVFDVLIHSESVAPGIIFFHESLVKHYGSILRLFILENPSLVRIVISAHEQSADDNTKVYLPSELTGQDICDCLVAYIDSERPNCNLLDKIYYMNSSVITDVIRLKAKRRGDKERESMLDRGVSIQTGISLIINPNQVGEKTAEKVGDEYRVSYSEKWLKETLDYPSVLNNFIYLFEYADVRQMRCQLVAKESQMGIFEQLGLPQGRNMYPRNGTFDLINCLSIMQMAAYYDFLKKNGIRYEDVLGWFFTHYLQEEFLCSPMRVSFPSEGTSYAEKCPIICNAIETIFKQFDLYVNYKEIDFELLSIQSFSKRMGDIPSLVNRKYLYPRGNELFGFRYHLFSDQCILAHVGRILELEKEYKSFYSLITKETVSVSDYSERERETIAYLQKNELVKIDINGRISPGNTIRLAIIKDLYENDVISRWQYPASAYPIIDEWIEKGLLREGSSLLSEPEADYFDYILNDATYANGLKLRNKYSHGIQQAVCNENEHEQNYYALLEICTLIAIKINDDFCLREHLQKEVQ